MANLTQESLTKVKLLHVGVDVPPPAPKRSHNGLITGICPASLIKLKGHEYLFDAIQLLKNRCINIRVLMAGSGPLEGELRSRCAKMHLEENIFFLGQLQHHKLLAMYDSGTIDFTVLPSLVEGIPVSLMEAMARKVPVIGTAVGGTPELLRDGAGLLVTPKKPHAMASAIELLVTRPFLVEEITSKGYKRVKQEFNLELIVQELVDCFESPSSENRDCSTTKKPVLLA
jgi:glycosyltransferase involved in cell wall biosynthesis